MVPPSCKPPRPAPITYRIPLLSLSAFRRRATKEARYPDRHTHTAHRTKTTTIRLDFRSRAPLDKQTEAEGEEFLWFLNRFPNTYVHQ